MALLAVGVSTPASASELRFSRTAAGQVVATGNTLGLAKEFAANGPGFEDSIGTFISLDDASVDDDPANPGNPWPMGTTGDWTLNGAEAELDIPPQVEVLHAELVWGGSSFYGSEDVRAFVDEPVTLSVAGGGSELITPDPITALDLAEVAFSGFEANYYMRSADVTAFVQDNGAGMYAVSGIPATQTVEINSLNAAGWTLLVAYRDSGEPIRNLTIFVGGSFVDEDSVEDYEFAGFCTPPSGAFEGRVVVSTIEGDAELTGDSFRIGETIGGASVPLSGPNNPVDNFFCSQLNDSSGNVDMSGSFGDANHDAAGGFTVAGGRQGWDVTSIAASSAEGHFSNGQTEAVLTAVTTGDSFVPIATGFAIEVNAPDFSSEGNGAQGDPLVLALGETSTVTVNMRNDGLVDATGLVFRAPLPEGLELSSFAIDGNDGDIDGNAVDDAGLMGGVPVGDIAVGVSRQIVFEVVSTGAPANDVTYLIQPRWDYDYVSCAGEPPLTEPHSTAPVIIDFDAPEGTTGGLDDTAGDEASGGDSGEGSGTGADTAGDDDGGATTSGVVSGSASAGTVTETDGCGCRSNGSAPGGALLMLLGLLGLRRRRH
ncbi:MAG: MYXO-CTERM sorting domain-containing protein [Myxococcota bacterium]